MEDSAPEDWSRSAGTRPGRSPSGEDVAEETQSCDVTTCLFMHVVVRVDHVGVQLPAVAGVMEDIVQRLCRHVLANYLHLKPRKHRSPNEDNQSASADLLPDSVPTGNTSLDVGNYFAHANSC